MPVKHSVLNVKAVVAAFNQEKALVGAFSVITNLRMELFQALIGSAQILGMHYPEPFIVSVISWPLPAAARVTLIK